MHPQDQVDEQHMRRTLDLARATVGLASPNPQVGCVLVRDGQTVGEGAHLYDDRDHAEIVALAQAGERASGATAYVTLEPCSHHGRTPPCANALIAAGVQRVVAATLDPNPQVAGQGVARLRAAGVEVSTGVCGQEARELNDAFACFIRTGRPLVTLKAALSVDGMIAPPAAMRTAKQPYWITGPAARAEGMRLRHAADAVLTGIGTVLADDPQLTDRSGILGPGGRPRRRPLLRVVLDSYLRTPLDSQLVLSASGDLLICCGEDASAGRAEALEAAGVEIARILADDGHLDPGAVLDLLGARKILGLLLEGGSALNGAFLTHGLVDQLALFYGETELGRNGVPFAAGIGPPALVEKKMQRVVRSAIGPDATVRGYLRDPWAAVAAPPAAAGDALGNALS